MFLRNPGKKYFYRHNNATAYNGNSLDCPLVQDVLVLDILALGIFILKYASPWKRLAAFGVNTLVNFYLFYPFYLKMHQKINPDFEITTLKLNLVWFLPLTALLTCGLCRTTAPGKFILKTKIVDAETGKKPTKGQRLSRIIGYNLSFLVFGLGFFYMFVDHRKQTWHDKIAETVVIDGESF